MFRALLKPVNTLNGAYLIIVSLLALKTPIAVGLSKELDDVLYKSEIQHDAFPPRPHEKVDGGTTLQEVLQASVPSHQVPSQRQLSVESPTLLPHVSRNSISSA